MVSRVKFFDLHGKRRGIFRVHSLHGRGKRRIITGAFIVLLLLFCVLLFTDSRLKPLVKESGTNALKNRLTVLLNESVDKALAAEAAEYGDFVRLEKDEKGNIKAVVCDTRFINAFQQRLSDDASVNIEKNGDFSISIPLGTLLNSQLFSGRGPRIKLHARAYGFAVTNVFSSLESVGINQTIHRVNARVTLSASARIGTYRVSETVEEVIPVAETVILGDVPQTYIERNND